MKKLSLLYTILLFSTYSYSQNSSSETTFWRLLSLNGEVNLSNYYWDQKTVRNNYKERLESSFLSGELLLNSKSYFYHPNFLTLDLDVGYSPETGQLLSVVTPDRNEINSLKKVDARVYLFKNNALNLSVFANLNESYNNRENLTNLKTNFENIGSVLSFSNKYLPLTLSYNKGKGEQLELQTDRSYITETSNFEVKTSKSFGKNDWNQFVYSHNEYLYDDKFLVTQLNPYGNIIDNKIVRWNLSNNFFLDSKKNYSFVSRISDEDQSGDYNYKRFEVLESIFFKLPQNFNLYGNYNFFDIKGDITDLKQQDIRGTLSHQLYKSLRTNVSFESNNINDIKYKEIITRKGLDIRYDKKIPLDGQLTLSYLVSSYNQERISDDTTTFIQREDYKLTDSQIILLNNQNVNISTVVVKDVTGTITYQLNFDYILIERNELLEIQRMPGGQIANNETVYIDYITTLPQSYKYNAITNSFLVNIALYKNKLEFYYKKANQDYIDPINEELFTLDYYNQNLYGSRFNLNSFSGGVEYDNYKSTLIPYRLMRYYLIVQGELKKNLYYTLNGDIRDYLMIVDEGIKQKYYNISGSLSYNFNAITKLNFESSYIKQEGEGIDLDLITARLELTTRFRQLFLSTGIDLYNSKLFNEKLDFKRLTIRLSRRF
tara:strand:- start:1611 stop:3590 length:1980 start_codon:yes stop_codon:yes gene_type:complete